MKTVTCDDFEPLVNAQLDARGLAAPELDEALTAHAAICSRCRALDHRYRALRRALDARRPAPPPPDSLVARILDAHEAESIRLARVASRSTATRRWAAAAAVLALAVGASLLRPWAGRVRTPEPQIALEPRPMELRPMPTPSPLSEALAEATAATLELALETSGPAARVGRGVLASAAVSRAQFTAPATADGAPADRLQSLEDGGTEGVRPLSGSARNAFRFLLPPDLGG